MEYKLKEIAERAPRRNRSGEAFHHMRELLLDDCHFVKQYMLDIFQGSRKAFR